MEFGGVVEEVEGSVLVVGAMGEMTREAEVLVEREARRRAGWPNLLIWFWSGRAEGEGVVGGEIWGVEVVEEVEGDMGEMTREAEEVSGEREARRRAGWPNLLPWRGEEGVVRVDGEGLVEGEGVVESGVVVAGVVVEEVVGWEEVVKGEAFAGRQSE